MVQINSSTKTAAPSMPEGLVHRERLFRLLDKSREKPIVWLSAPGGSGKTTLVTSYLQTQQIPFLWYQVDERDTDPATFFYFMDLALQERFADQTERLPLLTPEYLGGIKTFTRRYFEQLFKSLPVPFTIVFDNYQDVSLHAAFHETISEGLSLIPPDITIIVLSRNEPPPLFITKDSAERYNFIGWNDIRFLFHEAQEFAQLQTGKHLPIDALMHLYVKTDGWISGLLLMLESLGNSAIDYEALDRLSLDKVFDYFANEIFSRNDHETQVFLLKTAFAPGLKAQMAEQLTGIRSSERILAKLARNHFFTMHRSQVNPVYEYHPLFREFLLARAIKTFSLEEVTNIRRKAALLLAESGRIEAAAGLYIEAADWEGITELIIKIAPILIAGGRSTTLQGLLGSIPKDILNKTSWLLYWTGTCLIMVNPAEARGSLEIAFKLFKLEADRNGIFLSWASIVDTFMYEWRNFRPLEYWISEIELLIDHYQDFGSREIEDRVTCCMFSALMLRQPDHPALLKWQAKAEEVANSSPNKTQRMFIGYNLVFYKLWMGKVDAAGQIVDILSPLFKKSIEHSLAQLMWFTAEALYAVYAASYQRAMAAVTTGLAIADETGIHVADVILLGEGIYCSLSTGDLTTAEAFLKKIDSRRNLNSCYDIIHFHHQTSLVAMQRGDFLVAKNHAETCFTLTQEAGFPLVEGLHQYALSVVLIRASRYEDIPKHITEIKKIGSKARSPMLELCSATLEALLAINSHDNENCIEQYLSHLLTLNRKTGINTILFQGLSEQICVKALEKGLHVEYVQELIRRHNITPHHAHTFIENWPWSLKIRTLGAFEIILDDKPVVFSSKLQKKPLELLKLLLSLGGKNVSAERLADTLWPEADGDFARKSFDTTLHRLRKLIGNAKALPLQAGKLSLDLRYSLVDTQAFEYLCDDIENLRKKPQIEKYDDELILLCKKANSLYQGHFLPLDRDQSWTSTIRARLRKRYLTVLGKAGRYCEEQKQWDEAIDWYRRAIEVDSLSEEFYRYLMLCYQKQGMSTEALRIYDSCRSALANNIGAVPSSKTEEIYKAIVGK